MLMCGAETQYNHNDDAPQRWQTHVYNHIYRTEIQIYKKKDCHISDRISILQQNFSATKIERAFTKELERGGALTFLEVLGDAAVELVADLRAEVIESVRALVQRRRRRRPPLVVDEAAVEARRRRRRRER